MINYIVPIFVDKFIPDSLLDGHLYISEIYKTAIHKCACGCGIKTITPLNQDGWILTKNNEKVSLYPSVRNTWNCGSHYYITDNQIIWLN